MTLEEGHLSIQILLVTSVAKRAISRKTAGQRELALAVTHPRSLQMRLHNGSLRSLLFEIQKILQNPPLPTTKISKSGTPLAIMVMLHGDLAGSMYTKIGKTSKARIHLLVFIIPLTIQ